MSIQELVAKHINEGKNMIELSFEGQHEKLPCILEVNPEKEDLNYNEDITLRNNGELEKLKRVEDDAQELKDLFVKEDESTSSKSHEMIREEVVKTISEMTPWGEMHEKLKIEEVTSMSKVEEYNVMLNKEMEVLIVK